MRVLIVNTEYKRGGAAGIAQTLHREPNCLEGFESLFAFGRGSARREPETLRFALQGEVYLHALLTRLTGMHGYGSWLSTRRLLRLIREWEPDVIHFHNIHGYYLDLSIAEAVGRLGIPVVWTLHDAWPLTGRCAYFFECQRWKTGCGNCPDLSRYPKTYLDTSALMWKRKKHYFAQGWDPAIVTPSQWLADRVRESYLSKYRTEVIPNGIDTGTFSPRDRIASRKRLGVPLEKRVILFVAADLNDERKGARYFFESLQYINTNNYMVLTLGKRMNLNGTLPERADVKQLGYIAGRNFLAEVYSAADVFCITSLDDNFPTTVLESMACGTPVVGFHVGGIPEQVTEDCGILVEPKNVKKLAEAINELLNNNEKRKLFSLNCRKRVLENYSIEKFKESYINLYKNILK